MWSGDLIGEEEEMIRDLIKGRKEERRDDERREEKRWWDKKRTEMMREGKKRKEKKRKEKKRDDEWREEKMTTNLFSMSSPISFIQNNLLFVFLFSTLFSNYYLSAHLFLLMISSFIML